MRTERLEVIRNILNELAHAHTLAAVCLSQLEELLATDTAAEVRPAGSVPRVDESKFRITLGNRICYLGHTTSFRLFTRLLRRADHFISYDHLLRDVWGNDVRSAATVRSAVRQLKKKLKRAKMRQLSRAIRGQGHCYGLILGRTSSK